MIKLTQSKFIIKMKKVFIPLLLLAIYNNSRAQIPTYGTNGKKSYSKEIITLTEDGTPVTLQSGTVLATLGPTVFKAAYNITKDILKNRLEKFTSEYDSRYTNDAILTANQQIVLHNLKLEREYRDSKDTKVPGFIAKFEVSGNTEKNAFQYTLTDLQFDRSKAKGRKKDAIDLKFDITFTALIETDGKSEFKEVATNSISVKGVKIGQSDSNLQYASGWFPIPPLPVKVDIDDQSFKKIDADQMLEETLKLGYSIGDALSAGWIGSNSKHVKFSKIDDKNYGYVEGSLQAGGAYSISIKVKEANPRRIRAEKLSEFFENNSETANSLAEKVIELLTKEDEEEDSKE